ncbi:NADH-quinone oxidoreductase subunit C [Arcanobacterium canis]|uniref:NADH-quinone oxidoreductase subunit C n=1 Tax=Arcanobacterium canis TaxID=999183 RepID=A0ABY8FZV7_9ACTO|nr:NADH-quinone oxidoreductase subunit C [Arcanobacterium canis]WFM83083.1 NADH-quinone oxidoreductase subunit C [Arcanobacterium canis]
MSNNEIAPAGAVGPEVIARRSGMWGVKDSGDTTGFSTQREIAVVAPPATRPYGGWFDDVVDIILELGASDGFAPEQLIEKVSTQNGQLVIFVPRDNLLTVARYCRDDQDLRFEMTLGVSAVHYPQDQGRELHGYFPLFSFTHNRMIALEVTAPDDDPRMPSLVSVYPGDDWSEREAFDLMGIVFDGHPALVRSAMPDDWVGHPQRKDYPLGGIPVEYKGAVVPPPDTRREYN